jgi:hypothetical protein
VSEVADARTHRLIDEDVRGLEVAVENILGVQICHPQCDSNDDLRRVGRRPVGSETDRSGSDPLGGNQQGRIVSRGRMDRQEAEDAGVVKWREDGDFPHAVGRRIQRRSDGLHRQLPPASRVEVTADNSEDTASDGTPRLQRGEVEIGQFGGRGADLRVRLSNSQICTRVDVK